MKQAEDVRKALTTLSPVEERVLKEKLRHEATVIADVSVPLPFPYADPKDFKVSFPTTEEEVAKEEERQELERQTPLHITREVQTIYHDAHHKTLMWLRPVVESCPPCRKCGEDLAFDVAFNYDEDMIDVFCRACETVYKTMPNPWGPYPEDEERVEHVDTLSFPVGVRPGEQLCNEAKNFLDDYYAKTAPDHPLTKKREAERAYAKCTQCSRKLNLSLINEKPLGKSKGTITLLVECPSCGFAKEVPVGEEDIALFKTIIERNKQDE